MGKLSAERQIGVIWDSWRGAGGTFDAAKQLEEEVEEDVDEVERAGGTFDAGKQVGQQLLSSRNLLSISRFWQLWL